MCVSSLCFYEQRDRTPVDKSRERAKSVKLDSSQGSSEDFVNVLRPARMIKIVENQMKFVYVTRIVEVCA